MRCLRELRPLTRPRLALLVTVGAILVMVGLCVSLWVNEGPLCRLVMTRTSRFELQGYGGHAVVGWRRDNRWNGQALKSVAYYTESGFKAFETHFRKGSTYWTPHGRLSSQLFQQGIKDDPSWRWGVTDQTEPTMPGWKPKR